MCSSSLVPEQLDELKNSAVFLSNAELVLLLTQLGTLISSNSSTCADLQTSLLLLAEILSSPSLLGSRTITELELRPLLAAVSNMTAPSHTDQWCAVEGNTSAAVSLLQLIESLTKRAPEVLQDTELKSLQVEGQYASVRTEKGRGGAQFSVSGSTIFIPGELVLVPIHPSCCDLIGFSSCLAFGEDTNMSLLYLESFSSSLPLTPYTNVIASSPIWVVEIQGRGVDQNNLRAPIIITFPTPAQVVWTHDISFETGCVTACSHHR